MPPRTAQLLVQLMSAWIKWFCQTQFNLGLFPQQIRICCPVSISDISKRYPILENNVASAEQDDGEMRFLSANFGGHLQFFDSLVNRANGFLSQGLASAFLISHFPQLIRQRCVAHHMSYPSFKIATFGVKLN